MIEQSFIFLKDVSYIKEQQLWQQVPDWNAFLNTSSLQGVGAKKKFMHNLQIRKAQKALQSQDSYDLAKLFPRREHWRLYQQFRNEAVFLDIETSQAYGNIVVIGLYDGENVKQLVKGFNLDKALLTQELKNYKVLVTFNGASFDLPVIQRFFRDIVPAIPHIDLRGVCTRLGWSGGLKQIEKKQGLTRPGEVKGLSGIDAVFLWDKFMVTQNRSYLDRLLLYNEQDIVNLKPLAEVAIPKLWERVRGAH